MLSKSIITFLKFSRGLDFTLHDFWDFYLIAYELKFLCRLSETFRRNKCFSRSILLRTKQPSSQFFSAMLLIIILKNDGSIEKRHFKFSLVQSNGLLPSLIPLASQRQENASTLAALKTFRFANMVKCLVTCSSWLCDERLTHNSPK